MRQLRSNTDYTDNRVEDFLLENVHRSSITADNYATPTKVSVTDQIHCIPA